jgi:hypothetical protein
MKMFKLFVLIAMAMLFINCGGGGGGDVQPFEPNFPDIEDDVLKANFPSPSDYLYNKDVNRVVGFTGFPIYVGETDEPILSGLYDVDLIIIDSDMPEIIGERGDSEVYLYNEVPYQYSFNIIDYRETVQTTQEDVIVDAKGNFVTGNNGYFTMYQEGDQVYESCTVHVVALISGYQNSDGDLVNVEGISVATKKTGCENYIVSDWHESAATFNLISSTPTPYTPGPWDGTWIETEGIYAGDKFIIVQNSDDLIVTSIDYISSSEVFEWHGENIEWTNANTLNFDRIFTLPANWPDGRGTIVFDIFEPDHDSASYSTDGVNYRNLVKIE